MCRPNCEREMENGSVCVFAARNIEAGAQLDITYIIEEFNLNVREIRRAKLRQNFGFDCCCSICEVSGSLYWIVDQQKRSLIAPWSLEMAKKVMDKGWEVLYTSRRTKLTPTQAIQMLEPAKAVITRTLDQHIIFNYAEVGDLEYEKGVKQFELTINMNTDNKCVCYGALCLQHYV